MNKVFLIEQEIEWISFQDFVKHIKKTTKPPHWSGRFHGHTFTHENDGLYYISRDRNSVRFHADEALCFTKDNRAFTLNHPIYRLVATFSSEDVYMEVVKLLEKAWTGCKGYNETAEKLREKYIITKR